MRKYSCSGRRNLDLRRELRKGRVPHYYEVSRTGVEINAEGKNYWQMVGDEL
tara:strand:- start:4763 stop:4918 length:156 start_codon:yes stop_codon:yes gene_type:complete